MSGTNNYIAHIERYDDPRLFGRYLTKPFTESYEWIRTVRYPFPPSSHRVTECAYRALKLVGGVLLAVAFVSFFVLGRIVQIAHFHAKGEKGRVEPKEVTVNETDLPSCRSVGQGFVGWWEVTIGLTQEELTAALRGDIFPMPFCVINLPQKRRVVDDHKEYAVTIAYQCLATEAAYLEDSFSPKEIPKLRKVFLENGFRYARIRNTLYSLDSSTISVLKVAKTGVTEQAGAPEEKAPVASSANEEKKSAGTPSVPKRTPPPVPTSLPPKPQTLPPPIPTSLPPSARKEKK